MQLADPIPAPANEHPAPSVESAAVKAPPADPGAEQHDPLISSAAHTLRIPIHVNARGLALGIIATIAFVYALQWSQKFLVPLLLGIFIAYTLNPVVLWLERRLRIKRAIGATIVTVAILVLMGGVLNRVQGEFFNIIDELPTITQKVTRLLTNASGGQPSTIQQMQAAASQIEQATSSVGGQRPSARKAVPAAAAAGGTFKIMDWVLAGSMGFIGFITQATMVVFLVFFLLLAGDTFKRKLVKLTGPSLSRKKVTVHILDDINSSIQNYMFMLLVTNTLLALMMWVALRALGLENAGAWAIFAGLMHIMPYFGPLLITALTGLVAFMQFESLEMVLLVSGASLAIATLVGTVIATWMTGKIAKMNPAAVFVSLLFWGWLWGMWGLLLGVPVVVMIKVVAERVEGMEVLAELLGE
ncbi:AI-2E family transporter [Massilia violaceinigra]|uniref:AI-2E family transporter n=1 Tax=Massilia violaceinigra TaxID=2045208 RepID=A0A2D2DT93_9BURK|nr:AI-2E family transporter [Massilia violaceinigra]ATQ78200.1 AI-2E family transporter [Massilia violaceinigra]